MWNQKLIRPFVAYFPCCVNEGMVMLSCSFVCPSNNSWCIFIKFGTNMKMTVFWDVASSSCSQVEDEHRPDDGGGKHLRNVGDLLPDYTVQHLRSLSYSYSPQWEPEISVISRRTLWRCGLNSCSSGQGPVSNSCEHDSGIFGLHRRRGISWPSEWLSASEGPCCMHRNEDEVWHTTQVDCRRFGSEPCRGCSERNMILIQSQT
jgi:hypothetical protein